MNRKLASAFLLMAFPVFAQAPKSEVKCRPLVAGDYIGPNESIVGSGANAQVCSVAVVKAATEKDATPQPPSPVIPPPNVSSTPFAVEHEKPIVFLNGSGNTQTTVGRGLFGTTQASTSQHDQSLELAKDFGSCPVTISLKQENADYTVVLNHEGNNHNQMALTNASGEVLITDTAHGMHQSIKNKSEKFCAAILADWRKKEDAKTIADKKATANK